MNERSLVNGSRVPRGAQRRGMRGRIFFRDARNLVAREVNFARHPRQQPSPEVPRFVPNPFLAVETHAAALHTHAIYHDCDQRRRRHIDNRSKSRLSAVSRSF